MPRGSGQEAPRRRRRGQQSDTHDGIDQGQIISPRLRSGRTEPLPVPSIQYSPFDLAEYESRPSVGSYETSYVRGTSYHSTRDHTDRSDQEILRSRPTNDPSPPVQDSTSKRVLESNSLTHSSVASPTTSVDLDPDFSFTSATKTKKSAKFSRKSSSVSVMASQSSTKKMYRGRSTTGCITCRARRIKCDEAKPHCNNCSTAKKTCMGYLPPGVKELPVDAGLVEGSSSMSVARPHEAYQSPYGEIRQGFTQAGLGLTGASPTAPNTVGQTIVQPAADQAIIPRRNPSRRATRKRRRERSGSSEHIAMREINHATHLPTHLTSEAAQRTRFTTNEALASSSNPFPAPPQSRAVTMGPPPSGPQDNGTHAAAYYVSDVPADLLALPQLDSNPRQMTWEDYTPSLSFNPPHRPADLQFAYSNSRVNESTAVYGLPTPITAGTSSAQGNLGASPGSFYTGYDFGSEASAVPTRQMYPTYNTFGSGYPPATQQGYPMYHDNYATRSLETAPVFPGATSSFPMARSDTASHAPSEPLGAYPPINLYDLRGSFAYENEYAPTGPQNSFGPPSAPSYPYLPQPSSGFLLSNPLRHQAGLAHGIGSGYDVLSDHSSFGNPGYGSTNPRAPPPAPSSSNLAYRGRFGPRYAPAPVDPYIDYQQRAPRIQAGAYHPRTSFGQPLAPFPFGDLYASTDALGITTAGAEPATLLGTADFGSPLPAPQAIQTVSFHGVGATRASGLGSPFGETRGEEGDGLGRVGDDDTVDEEAEVERARGR